MLEDTKLKNKYIEPISGFSAGFLSTLIFHPFDLIKIKFQLSKQNTKFRYFFNQLTDINTCVLMKCQKNNFTLLKNFYNGLSINLLGNSIAYLSFFTLYNELKNKTWIKISSLNYFSSSLIAGVCVNIITNPFWVLKTRILGSTGDKKLLKTSICKMFLNSIRNEGCFFMWKGLIPNSILVIQGSIQFTIYDSFKEFCAKSYIKKKNKEHTKTQYIFYSVISKIISVGIMYPFQVIKSRMQYFPEKKYTKYNLLHLFINMKKNEGISAFYKGLSFNIMKVLPSTTLTFFVYEYVKSFLSDL